MDTVNAPIASRVWSPACVRSGQRSLAPRRSRSVQLRSPRESIARRASRTGIPICRECWDHIDATPLERPAGFTTLAITAEQAAAIKRLSVEIAEDRSTPTEPTEYFNERHMLPIRGEFHSSIIIDPPDGRIPGTPQFKQWQVKTRAAVVNAVDGPEQRPTSERCLGNPAAQPPNLYNPGTNLHQIVQTKDAVVFLAEVMGFVRIIRLDARHAPGRSDILDRRLDRLVGGRHAGRADPVVQPQRHRHAVAAGITFMVSPGATVTERITRVSDAELNYVFTVDDPSHYTRPWTGETHFMRTDDRLFESACHEANYSMRFILQGGRARDAESTSIRPSK